MSILFCLRIWILIDVTMCPGIASHRRHGTLNSWGCFSQFTASPTCKIQFTSKSKLFHANFSVNACLNLKKKNSINIGEIRHSYPKEYWLDNNQIHRVYTWKLNDKFPVAWHWTYQTCHFTLDIHMRVRKSVRQIDQSDFITTTLPRLATKIF